MLADGGRHRQHVLHIRAAVLIRRSTDSNENHLAMGHCRRGVDGELESSAGMVLPHDRFQAWLVDGDLAGPHARDLGRIDIDADHVISHFGQTRAGDESDIAGTENSDLHRRATPLTVSRLV